MKTNSVAVKTMKNSLLLPWPREHQSNANKYFNLTSIFQIKNILFKTKFQDQIGSTNAKFPKRVSQTLRPWEETFGASIKLLYKNTWYRFISFFLILHDYDHKIIFKSCGHNMLCYICGFPPILLPAASVVCILWTVLEWHVLVLTKSDI